MLDIQRFRTEAEHIKAAMRAKGYAETDVVDRIANLDEARRTAVTELQSLQEASNQVAKTIGILMREGKKDEAQARIAESGRLKAELKEKEEAARGIEETLAALLLEVPNPAHESVPEGRTPDDNRVDMQTAEAEPLPFESQSHWDLLDRHGLVDFDRGAKVTGAGFPFYLGRGARIQRALINLFLDTATSEGGYTEIEPPVLVNEDSARGTGQLPDKEDQMYEVPRDGLFLIPTAEVPVTNLLRGEILAEQDLPVRYCAYTPCFRREAGSYGKDVRGLNRLHQFDKVELVQFVHPDRSYEALESMREDAEGLLKALELPYRRLVLCTGDMGFTQAKTYDLEVWSAAQERWLEVSSISNFESFQARRANIRFRPDGGGKPEFVHTLNGSALALPRIVAALLENNQQPDGTIVLPKALAAYTGFERIA